MLTQFFFSLDGGELITCKLYPFGPGVPDVQNFFYAVYHLLDLCGNPSSSSKQLWGGEGIKYVKKKIPVWVEKLSFCAVFMGL